MKIWIINGPNLNLLGMREPEVYGSNTYQQLIDLCQGWCDDLGVDCAFFQSNEEGKLVTILHQAYAEKVDAIVFNPGAYTHTSIALLDALQAIKIPCIEVHISDLKKREAFRQHSYIALACVARVIGKGIEGYREAIELAVARRK